MERACIIWEGEGCEPDFGACLDLAEKLYKERED
jgi:hypothetical protein